MTEREKLFWRILQNGEMWYISRIWMQWIGRRSFWVDDECHKYRPWV